MVPRYLTTEFRMWLRSMTSNSLFCANKAPHSRRRFICCCFNWLLWNDTIYFSIVHCSFCRETKDRNDTRNNYKCLTKRHRTWGHYGKINTDFLARKQPAFAMHFFLSFTVWWQQFPLTFASLLHLLEKENASGENRERERNTLQWLGSFYPTRSH